MLRYDARQIRAVLDRGENVMQWLQERGARGRNSASAILYAYDAQAGSYVSMLDDPEHAALKTALGRRLVEALGPVAPESLLEAGIGEATSLVPTLAAMTQPPAEVFGFDLSLSRLLFARRHLAAHGYTEVTLYTAALERIPLPAASIDAVLTVHAVEPNRGEEDAILRELLRVARRRLVMVEPCYEIGDSLMRRRMDRLAYARGLPEILRGLGCAEVRVEALGVDSNPENPAVLIVADPPAAADRAEPHLVSPVSGGALERRPDCLFCPDDGHAFPVIAGIPCLTVEGSVLASKLAEF